MLFDRFLRNRGRRTQASRGAPAIPTPPAANPQAEAAEPFAEELLIQAIQQFRSTMRSIESKLRARRPTALAAAQARVRQAQRFLQSSGVGRSLLRLLEEVSKWLTSGRRGNLRQHVHFDAHDLAGEERQDAKGRYRLVCFTYQGERYRMELDQHATAFPDTRTAAGTLRLFQNDICVVSLEIFHPLGSYAGYDSWDWREIDQLSLGTWVGHLVEIDEQIRLAETRDQLDRQSSSDADGQRLLARASRLPASQ